MDGSKRKNDIKGGEPIISPIIIDEIEKYCYGAAS
jgi:hypothetical protein